MQAGSTELLISVAHRRHMIVLPIAHGCLPPPRQCTMFMYREWVSGPHCPHILCPSHIRCHTNWCPGWSMIHCLGEGECCGLSVVAHAYNHSTCNLSQEDHKFKASTCCTTSSGWRELYHDIMSQTHKQMQQRPVLSCGAYCTHVCLCFCLMALLD